MDRRSFLQSIGLGAMYVAAPAAGDPFAGTARKIRADRDTESLIRQRLAERPVLAEYLSGVRCLRRPELAEPTREAMRRHADFVAAMEPGRVRGLFKLLETDLEPAVKRLLLNLGLERVPHEIATCLEHFLGVFDLLRGWGHTDDEAFIGLLHAIYGTEFNQLTVLDYRRAEDREKLSRVVGEAGERRARAYGLVDSAKFIATLGAGRTRFALASDFVMEGAECALLADALVANTLEPLLADGDVRRLAQLSQFEPLRPYLCGGARQALRFSQGAK